MREMCAMHYIIHIQNASKITRRLFLRRFRERVLGSSPSFCAFLGFRFRLCIRAEWAIGATGVELLGLLFTDPCNKPFSVAMDEGVGRPNLISNTSGSC